MSWPHRLSQLSDLLCCSQYTTLCLVILESCSLCTHYKITHTEWEQGWCRPRSPICFAQRRVRERPPAPRHSWSARSCLANTKCGVWLCYKTSNLHLLTLNTSNLLHTAQCDVFFFPLFYKHAKSLGLNSNTMLLVPRQFYSLYMSSIKVSLASLSCICLLIRILHWLHIFFNAPQGPPSHHLNYQTAQSSVLVGVLL